MTIRYVPTSDNKYVQFRYMLEYENTTAGNTNFVNPYNWESNAVLSNKNLSGADLTIEDEGNKAIVIFSNGNIKTKNFDSSKNASESKSGLMSSADKTKLDDVITIAGQSVGLGDSISASTLKQALNLSTAMRLIGKTSTTMTGAALSSPIIVIEGDSKTAENGDVVIETSTNYEYV